MCLGVPGKVIDLMDNAMIKVDVNGNSVNISSILTPEVKVGLFVMVHAGFSMQIMDVSEAEESLALMLELQKIREFYEYGS